MIQCGCTPKHDGRGGSQTHCKPCDLMDVKCSQGVCARKTWEVQSFFLACENILEQAEVAVV